MAPIMVCREHDLLCAYRLGAWHCPSCGDRCVVIPARTPASRSRQIARVLSDLDGLDQRDRYTEALRVAKIVEEAGEAMQALIAYHHTNPRKPSGSIEDVIKELCDVALTAKVAVESFGFDAEAELRRREDVVLSRLPALGDREVA